MGVRKMSLDQEKSHLWAIIWRKVLLLQPPVVSYCLFLPLQCCPSLGVVALKCLKMISYKNFIHCHKKTPILLSAWVILQRRTHFFCCWKTVFLVIAKAGGNSRRLTRITVNGPRDAEELRHNSVLRSFPLHCDSGVQQQWLQGLDTMFATEEL